MSLDAHAEVTKLAHELQADPRALDGLAVLHADDLRRLRGMVGDALHDAHRPAFQRAAAASALLPPSLTARLAQTLIGPYLAARIAAEMPTDRAVKLASHLEVDFLADVCLSLDPARVSATVQGLPDDRVIEVGTTLLARREYVTLGKFVGVVSPAVVDGVAERIHDPAALLAIARAIEARDRLDELMTGIDDERLLAMIAAAVAEQQVPAMVALTGHLGPANRRRLVALAASSAPAVVKQLVAALGAEDTWDDGDAWAGQLGTEAGETT